MIETVLLFIFILVLCGTAFSLVRTVIRPFHIYPHSEKKAVFQILIPARNEEAVIAALIDSIQRSDYPKDKFRISVLVNQSSDRTAEAAASCGAEVLHVNMHVSTKGDVLKYGFAYYEKNDAPDAYIILDADNVVHPEFLAKMNDAYQSGVVVAQGNRQGKNTKDSAISGCYEAFYLLQKVYLNEKDNVSALNGTGWMIAHEIIQKYGYPVKTMVEDAEYMAIEAIQKTVTNYVHEAITYDEFPATFAMSHRQMVRWAYGQHQCNMCYYKTLLDHFRREHDLKFLRILATYCLPAFMTVLFLILAVTLLLTGHVLILLAIYGVSLIVLLMPALKCRDTIAIPWRGIFLFPLLITSWAPHYLIAPFKKKQTWDEIPHKRTISIEEITKK